ncbi:MAG: helicase-related protein [Bacillus sp. (in: firmicutes)]
MIFNARRAAFQPVEIEDELTNEDSFFLQEGLSERQVELLDKIRKLPFEKLKPTEDIIRRSAAVFGRSCVDITLREAQIAPVLMSYVNPRFFIGDKPGLGKTVMSAACYAYYKWMLNKKGLTPKKVLVVTDSAHVVGFCNEWRSYGIDLVPLTKSSTGIARALRKHDMSVMDGVITNWDGLKTNGFLEYYLEHADDYGYGIFDETSKLLNPKSLLYITVDNIVNKYRGGIERVIFLNGSSFEKNIFDFYYQFGVLKPKLIPSKEFLEQRYIVRGGKEVYMQDFTKFSPHQKQVVKRKVGEIVDYRNQSELRDRLKYYYIARSKRDYSKDLPEHNYVLHGVGLTSPQMKKLSQSQNMSIINSPKTSDPDAVFTPASSPKLKAILEFAVQVEDDRPLFYVYNKESQRTVCDELTALGYRVKILNGDVSSEEKTEILREFNTGELDMLVFNVEKAVNIPTSDRIVFYDIPTMPQRTNQIKGRIDRNNYDKKKFYDFFCYLDSPEMLNIVKLAYFREHHSNQFTGQIEHVYGVLVKQLQLIYQEDQLESIAEKFAWMESNNRTFDDIEDEVRRILGMD